MWDYRSGNWQPLWCSAGRHRWAECKSSHRAFQKPRITWIFLPSSSARTGKQFGSTITTSFGMELAMSLFLFSSKALFSLLRFSSLTCGLLLLGLVVGAGPCPAQPTPPGTKFTVLPGVNTPVYLNVLPSAVCRLRQTDMNDDGDGWEPEDAGQAVQDVALPVGKYGSADQRFLRLYSDANGYVRFNSEPPVGVSEFEMKLSLRCSANGVRKAYQVVLRASETATEDMPFPPKVDPALSQADATTLPALSNPDQFTNEELMRLGYPPRPDASADPNAYALWLATVTKPITVLQPQGVANRGVRWYTTSNEQSSNWSGYELYPDGASEGYALVQGHWIVPSVRGELFRSSLGAEWVGLDGDPINFSGLTDLVQAGTSENVLPVAVVGPPMLGRRWNLSTDFAWTEVLPLQIVGQVIPNFPVHPGDGILCTVWVGWVNSQPDPTGGYAFFQLINSSVYDNNGQPVMVTVPTRIVDESGFNYLINFRGWTAEWIVERPTIIQGGQPVGLADLPNYQSQCYGKTLPNYLGMYMDATAAWGRLGPNKYETFEYSGWYNFLFTMVGGGGNLSIPTDYDSHTICWTWVGFH